MILKQINYKQPKYILPGILFPLLVILGYFVFDMFNTKIAEKSNGLETTDYYNSKLPPVSIKGDGVGKKRENMEKTYGHITDFSAVHDAGVEDAPQKEEYFSKYTAEDIALLEQNEKETQEEMERLRKLQKELSESVESIQTYTDEDISSANKRRQEEDYEDFKAALAEIVGEAQATTSSNIEAEKDRLMREAGFIRDDEIYTPPITTEAPPTAVTEIEEDSEPEVAVKKQTEHSTYFNTISENDKQPGLIKAIIDEEIKAVDGSRVRLRLLDDIEIEGATVPKGTYLYATMSGFGSQRVKGSVSSILVEDRLIKIRLNIYDTDGMEGLYVPKSQFRETAKDVMSQAMSSPMQISSGSYQNQMATWGINALQNATSRVSSALGRNIKKNSAKLKYGTFVYLVNGRGR